MTWEVAVIIQECKEHLVEQPAEASFNLDQELLDLGIIWFTDEITRQSATQFIKRLQLLELRYLAANKPSNFRAFCYILSPGGEITATLAIVDFIRSLSMPVSAFGLGQVASAAVWVLAAFPKRYSFVNTRFLLHEGWLSAEGKPSDVAAYHREEQRNSRTLIKLLAEFTGRPVERFKGLLSSKEAYFGAEEARKLGIINEIITCD